MWSEVAFFEGRTYEASIGGQKFNFKPLTN